MKKPTSTKLTLDSQTVRTLTQTQLDAVEGGCGSKGSSKLSYRTQCGFCDQ